MAAESRPESRSTFPLAAIGPTMSAAAAVAVEYTQAPIELSAHHILTLAATAAQRRISIALPTGGQRPVSCYFMTPTGPGEGHSALEKKLVAPLRAWGSQPRLLDQLGLFLEPRAPCTSDRYRRLRRQAGLFAGFADAVISPGRTRRAEALSLAALWDGRVEHDAVLPDYHPRLSVHLVPSPPAGERLLRDPMLAECGIQGRILCAVPASRMGERSWRVDDGDSPLACRELFARLIHLHAADRAAPMRVVAFTPGAVAAWLAFAQEVELAMRDGGVFARIRQFAARLAEHAARLAAVIAYVEDETLASLDEVALARGIVLARFYAAEALRLEKSAPVSASEAEEKLREWLERTQIGKSVTLREVCRLGPYALRDADTAYKAMRRLERQGVVQPRGLVSQPAGTPRRAGRRYAWCLDLEVSPSGVNPFSETG